MENIYFLLLIKILILIILNFILIKKNLLIDKIENYKHKSFVSDKKIPISGGLYLIICIFLFIQDYNLINKLFLISIFVLGLLSDFDKLKSPLVRITLQFIIILSLIIYNSVFVQSTRIFFLDYLIENIVFFKVLFTIFCLLILINGTNFIDGVNCLASGYYICVISNLFILINTLDLNYSYSSMVLIYIALLIFFTFNFFSKTLLGDSGCYLISLIIGLFLINFVNNFQNLISPYYIILILWYPAFENLFSICRRIFIEKNKTPDSPDNLHLHQLLFLIYKKKFKLNKYSNTLSGITIVLFNFLIIFIGSKFANETMKLVYVVLFSVLFYILTYFYLKKKTQ